MSTNNSKIHIYMKNMRLNKVLKFIKNDIFVEIVEIVEVGQRLLFTVSLSDSDNLSSLRRLFIYMS